MISTADDHHLGYSFISLSFSLRMALQPKSLPTPAVYEQWQVFLLDL